MAKVTLTFEVPFMANTRKNQAKLKEALLWALEDMRVNNGHLLNREQYALAKLLSMAPYATPEDKETLEMLAKDAGVR